MSSATDLYQEIILHHSRQPRHYGPLPAATHIYKADNPLCGDSYTIYLQVEDGTIQQATFEGAGCAISKASASLMTDTVIGKTLSEFEAQFARFHALVLGGPEAPKPEEMGKLAAFSGIWKFPARVKCAMLAWHGVKNALKEGPQKEGKP